MSQLILVHTVKLKPIKKEQISGKLLTSGISDVATISVHSVVNESQEITVFGGR